MLAGSVRRIRIVRVRRRLGTGIRGRVRGFGVRICRCCRIIGGLCYSRLVGTGISSLCHRLHSSGIAHID